MKREMDAGQDLNLCRKFGEVEIGVGSDVLFYYPGSKAHGDVGKVMFISNNSSIVVQWDDKSDVVIYKNCSSSGAGVRLAPLCWVEGKPVYVGDKLYRKGIFNGEEMTVTQYGCHEHQHGPYVWGTGLRYAELGPVPESASGMYPDQMTWTKPVKPKVMVKKSGWMNIYGDARTPGVHFTLDAANNNAARGRKACIEIFWEEEE